MTPDRMRAIDCWLGIPLCAVLTAWRRLLSWVGQTSPAPPSRVLFIELAEMGSTVLACPAIRRLQQRHPGCEVFFLGFTNVAPGVAVLGLVPGDRVWTIDPRSPWSLLRDTIRFLFQARRQRIDTVINLEAFTRFSTLLAYASGARTRVGFHGFGQAGLYTGDLLTHRVLYNPHIHTWQSFAALVEALDRPAGESPLCKTTPDTDAWVPRIESDTAGEARGRRVLAEAGCRLEGGRRLVLVNPNASKLISIRKWPLANYAALVSRLLEDEDLWVGITGVAEKGEDARTILETVRSDRVVDLTGRTSLRELIDVYNLASLLVTNDSGPAHFASLTGIHVMVFFGPETPALYGPLARRRTVMYSGLACSPCVSAYNQRVTTCQDNQCLKTIGVDAAYQAAKAALGGRQ